MPVPKNDTSINSNPPFAKSVQVSVKEEKLMRFQYVCNKDTKIRAQYQIYFLPQRRRNLADGFGYLLTSKGTIATKVVAFKKIVLSV